MEKTNQKYTNPLLPLAAAVALTFSVPTASAALIDFDWQGNGSEVISNVASLDWTPGSSYTLGGTGSTLTNGDRLDTYLHGSLGSFLDQNGRPINVNYGLNTNYEVTFTAGFREEVFGITNVVNPVTGQLTQILNFVSVDDPFNFFEIYVDDTPDADALSGTGFNDGIRIASGTVAAGGGGNITSAFVFSGDPNDPISTDPANYPLMDQFGPDNWAGVRTNSGFGGSIFSAISDFVDDSFMLPLDENGNVWDGIRFDLSFNSSQIVPFNETNPSREFFDKDGTSVLADPGTINGINGAGVLLQVDGNSSFTTDPSVVPLPPSIFLFLSGLLGYTLIGRRKSVSV